MDDELVFIYTFIMKFILGMTIIATGIFFMHQTPIADTTKAFAEIAGVQGGFTDRAIEDMKLELQRAGYDLGKLFIEVEAYDQGGSKISEKAVGVTPPSQAPYPSNPKFIPRGGKIILTVYSNSDSPINYVFQLLTGTKSDIKNYSRRVIMSERVN